MEKLQLFYNDPLEAGLALFAAALLSIFGAFIKDWLLKLFSVFSKGMKARSVASKKRVFKQARFLLRDPVLLSLFTFRAVRSNLLWVTSNILSILLLVYAQQQISNFNFDSITRMSLFEALFANDAEVTVLFYYTFLGSITFLATLTSGYVSSARNRILYKAYTSRLKKLRAGIELP
ncbi:hypothetical protein BFG07_20985 [Kosakonia cowanii]|uniref:Uncharacterized protein n=1 Tax=Kosakonia cowanii JCM 10956 = DSM 18146 TaxID=1300165 RepID=A0A807LAR4_9ENTR|nr:hypothetical protein [Kosakonia cowanii]APZ04804.1 hypothetical protein BWI95_06890 [Kosakonia cowanii JCM 10956 = DSM 18146]AST70913.1 hypothetical protein BFG07_20985 [Kosakonia cowanii]